jgi:hypothetical protein
MASLLEIKLTGGPELIDAMQRKGPRIVQVLMSKVNALLFQLQSFIVGQKLSGQMLQRRTGKLAGSIRAVPAILDGASITGSVEGAGGPAFYGKFFEVETAGGTGGTRAHQITAVKARALRFLWHGNVHFAKSVQHPGFAARPFMTSSLLENADKIRTELQAALDKEVQAP